MTDIQDVLLADAIRDFRLKLTLENVQIPEVIDLAKLLEAYLTGNRRTMNILLGRHYYRRSFPN